MASSMAALSRRLSRALLSNTKPSHHHHSHVSPLSFCTKTTGESDSELEDPEAFLSDPESDPSPASSPASESEKPRVYQEPILEKGLDIGIFKAVLLGRVAQKPMQKKLKSGMTLTMVSVGTGGMRNNRRPLENESPREFAEKSSIQWHRVCIYPERLGDLVMQQALPGTMLYVDGNIETKIFADPITGVARRVREIAVRRSGRVVFLGKSDGAGPAPTAPEVRSVAY